MTPLDPSTAPELGFAPINTWEAGLHCLRVYVGQLDQPPVPVRLWREGGRLRENDGTEHYLSPTHLKVHRYYPINQWAEVWGSWYARRLWPAGERMNSDGTKRFDREAVRTEALRRVTKYLSGRGRVEMRAHGIDIGELLGLKLIGGEYGSEGVKVPIEPGDEPVTSDAMARRGEHG